MQFYYEEKMPLRVLDEGEFWKHQEAEHTQVIRALVKDLEPQYVQALQAWEQALSQTQTHFTRYIETVVRSGHHVSPTLYQQIMQLIRFALNESLHFVSVVNRLAAESQAIKRVPTAIVVLNHIRRESEYFIGISQALLA